MIIDTHQHVFWHGKDDAYLVADMEKYGIDHAWLLTFEIPQSMPSNENLKLLNPTNVTSDGHCSGMLLRDMICAKKAFPDRFVLGYGPNPLVDGSDDLFEAAYNMYGVRVCGEFKFRVLLDDPRCVKLFKKAGQLKCPVIIHMDLPYLLNSETNELEYQPYWYCGGPENLERTLQLCPETIFIGHGPGFWRLIGNDYDTVSFPMGPVISEGPMFELMDKYSNLYAETSANSAFVSLSRDIENAKKFLTRYCGRILFGRDYFGDENYSFLRSLDLPENVANKIFFENALKLIAKP